MPHHDTPPEAITPNVVARIGPRSAQRAQADTQKLIAADGPLNVLVVSKRSAWRKRLHETGPDLALSEVSTLETAARLLNASAHTSGDSIQFDVVVADWALPDGEGLELVGAAQRHGAGVILATTRNDIDGAVRAMRAGVADLVGTGNIRGGDLRERIVAAGQRFRNLRNERTEQLNRICALKRMCRRLNNSRREVVRQVDLLCTDLLQAYQEMAERMNQVSTASEFKGLIRTELDIESLLRTTLEFVLARSGPTNAAVFLPTTSGDYSLGAYVNYDCPKDTCDVLLDHLANSVAPRFENERDMVHMTDQRGLDRYVGDEAQWLNGSGVLAFPCRHDGECLAIFMLFRDQRSTFTQPLMDQLKTVGELFAAQLARVIHIHHRHLPKDKWGMLGDSGESDEREDYGGLAA